MSEFDELIIKHNNVKEKYKNIFINMLFEFRPKQWIKNIVVFAAMLFSIKVTSVITLTKSTLGFIIFCVVSGCVYVVNDIIDKEADIKHPEKCLRPIASGVLNPVISLVFSATLLLISLIIAWYLNNIFCMLLFAYFILNVLYSVYFKHVVIIDIMVIALGFVLRATSGALIIDVEFTPWFLFCIMFLALFLAIEKRQYELCLLNDKRGAHRKVLNDYTPVFLNQLSSVVTTGVVISYSLFTFTAGHTIQLMWTIPLVIYGLFRYMYLTHDKIKGGSPEKILVEDKHILGVVIIYIIIVILILFIFE